MEEKILAKGILLEKVKDVNLLDNDAYALIRKESFGGSDSSILCGVNLYTNLESLIREKNIKKITKEEQEVGNKPIVRKGRDLEPIILNKAQEELNKEVHKPTSMYVFKDYPILTLNYDGVMDTEDGLIPVEAKLVSKYGEKYYNKTKTIEDNKEVNNSIEDATLDGHIKKKALRYGIPPYYYTQCQQEMMGVDAPYCYLAVLFDDSWTFKLYWIRKDEYVQNKIIDIAEKNKDRIKSNS